MCNTSAPAKYEKLNVSEHHHQHVAAHYETEIHLDSSQKFIFISQPELIDGGWGKVAHKRKLSIGEMNYIEKIESFAWNIRETKESKMKNYPIWTSEIKIQDFKKKRKTINFYSFSLACDFNWFLNHHFILFHFSGRKSTSLRHRDSFAQSHSTHNGPKVRVHQSAPYTE